MCKRQIAELTLLAEMSTEEAVGILNYANAFPGFRGILKQRSVSCSRELVCLHSFGHPHLIPKPV